MKRILVAILFSGLNLAYAASLIEGTYKCHGHDPFAGKDYANGSVVITKTGEAYSLKFENDANGPSEIGTGVWDSSHQVLSVIYKDSTGQNKLGVQSYATSDNGKTLTGPWTNINESKVGTETCERQ